MNRNMKYAESEEKKGGRNTNLLFSVLQSFFFFFFLCLPLFSFLIYSAFPVFPSVLIFAASFAPNKQWPGGVPAVRINTHFRGEQLVTMEPTAVTTT